MVSASEPLGSVYVLGDDGRMTFRRTVRGRALAWSGLRRLYRSARVRRVFVAVGARWFKITRRGSWREVSSLFSLGAAVSIIVKGG